MPTDAPVDTKRHQYPGALLWEYPTGYAIDSSSPAVVNGVVYVGSWDYNVYALQADTGATLWVHHTGNAVGYSSPAVLDGVVYVGDVDFTVYALGAKHRRPTVGLQDWQFSVVFPRRCR